RRTTTRQVRAGHRDHPGELQSAWLNGVGVMVWDVVFGVWVGWSPRDAATVKRLVTVQRAARPLLLDGAWTPLAELAPEAEAAGVYASRWELDGVTMWTLVNRGDADYAGPLLPGGAGGAAGAAGSVGADVRVPGRGIAAALHVADDAEE